MKLLKRILYFGFAAWLLVSCVSNKRFKYAEANLTRLEGSYSQLQKQYKVCADTAQKYLGRAKSLQEQLQSQKETSHVLINQLKDLSVISSSQAESIKKSLENISTKDAYIRGLQSAIAYKDSLNMQLVMNLKGVISDLDDKDINIKIDKGVIYIDISEELLFVTGRYEVNERAQEVLGKVAKVLLNHPDIEFMVEGHTDPVPFKQGVLLDNWDLSVKRATSVIRILQNQYGIPPARMTAAGRAEYVPIAKNSTEDGKEKNRRTRIVILPQLDQFFKLLERPVAAY